MELDLSKLGPTHMLSSDTGVSSLCLPLCDTDEGEVSIPALLPHALRPNRNIGDFLVECQSPDIFHAFSHLLSHLAWVVSGPTFQ